MEALNSFLSTVNDWVWGIPLIVLIIAIGVLMTVRTGLIQIIHLPKAIRYMLHNEADGEGDVTSFGALCTALSATIGTGNIVGVATAIARRRPGRSVLDGGRCVLRYGYQICRRLARRQIP